jgi:hypothetical protein
MNQSQRAPVESASDKWDRFWFTREPLYTLGLVRLALGAVVIGWTVNLLPDLHTLFGENGPVPSQPGGAYRVGIFQVWTSDTAILVGWTVLLLSAIAMFVGWHSRLAAVGVWILLLSFIRRDPWIFNAGDRLICLTALVLALSSCGAALSLDQRRRTGRFWSAEIRAVWPIRLLQVQLSVVYLTTAQSKLIGNTWVDGTAVSYAWRVFQDWAILPVPQWVSDSSFLVNVATWGTLVIELSIAILVWNRRWRARVLMAGVALHIAIYFNLPVAFFSLAMFVLYLAFVPWQVVQRMPDTLRDTLHRLRRRRVDDSREAAAERDS